MANLNKVMLMGNLTRDPQLTFLPSQTACCDFGLAVNRTWTGQDGVKKEEVTFVDCTAFAKTAELLAKYKKKGDPLFIEGRLKLDQWEHEGQKRSKLKVIIENFQFLNRAAPGAYGGGQGGEAGNAAPAEYTGESDAPRPQAAPVRQPYAPRPAGRPMPAARPVPAPAPNYDAGDVPSVPEDDAPQIKEDDIPF